MGRDSGETGKAHCRARVSHKYRKAFAIFPPHAVISSEGTTHLPPRSQVASSMKKYVCVYICLYMCLYAYMYIFSGIYAYMCMDVYICIFVVPSDHNIHIFI